MLPKNLNRFLLPLLIALLEFWWVFGDIDFFEYVAIPISSLYTHSPDSIFPLELIHNSRSGHIWFSFLIALTFGLVYLFNAQKNKLALWFMNMFLASGLGFSGYFISYYFPQYYGFEILYILGQSCVTMAVISGSFIVLEFCEKKIDNTRKLFHKLVILSTLLSILFYFSKTPATIQNVLYFIHLFFITFLLKESLIDVYKGYLNKYFNIFVSICIAGIAFTLNFYLIPQHTINFNFSQSSTMILPFFAAIAVAYITAKSYTDLQLKQLEIEQLSDEKEHILEKQKEILAQQVAEQTAELKALNATKDRLFSVISHDLRTPIYSIIGALELIENKDLNQDESKDLLKNLRDDVSNTYGVLDNLLLWSLSQLKHRQPNQVNFDLIDAVASSVNLFRG